MAILPMLMLFGLSISRVLAVTLSLSLNPPIYRSQLTVTFGNIDFSSLNNPYVYIAYDQLVKCWHACTQKIYLSSLSVSLTLESFMIPGPYTLSLYSSCTFCVFPIKSWDINIIAAPTFTSQASFSQNDAVYVLGHAAAAYFDPNTLKMWNTGGCILCWQLGKAILYQPLDSSDFNFGYIVLHDNLPDTIFVSFRGTDNFWNYIQDFRASLMSYAACNDVNPFCKVHGGLYKGYTDIADDIVAKLSNIFVAGSLTKSNAKIVITGHSMGAAMASYAAYELSLLGYYVSGVFAYGSPFPGNSNFALSYNNVVGNGGGATLSKFDWGTLSSKNDLPLWRRAQLAENNSSIIWPVRPSSLILLAIEIKGTKLPPEMHLQSTPDDEFWGLWDLYCAGTQLYPETKSQRNLLIQGAGKATGSFSGTWSINSALDAISFSAPRTNSEADSFSNFLSLIGIPSSPIITRRAVGDWTFVGTPVTLDGKGDTRGYSGISFRANPVIGGDYGTMFSFNTDTNSPFALQKFSDYTLSSLSTKKGYLLFPGNEHTIVSYFYRLVPSSSSINGLSIINFLANNEKDNNPYPGFLVNGKLYQFASYCPSGLYPSKNNNPLQFVTCGPCQDGTSTCLSPSSSNFPLPPKQWSLTIPSSPILYGGSSVTISFTTENVVLPLTVAFKCFLCTPVLSSPLTSYSGSVTLKIPSNGGNALYFATITDATGDIFYSPYVSVLPLEKRFSLSLSSVTPLAGSSITISYETLNAVLALRIHITCSNCNDPITFYTNSAIGNQDVSIPLSWYGPSYYCYIEDASGSMSSLTYFSVTLPSGISASVTASTTQSLSFTTTSSQSFTSTRSLSSTNWPSPTNTPSSTLTPTSSLTSGASPSTTPSFTPTFTPIVGRVVRVSLYAPFSPTLPSSILTQFLGVLTAWSGVPANTTSWYSPAASVNGIQSGWLFNFRVYTLIGNNTVSTFGRLLSSSFTITSTSEFLSAIDTVVASLLTDGSLVIALQASGLSLSLGFSSPATLASAITAVPTAIDSPLATPVDTPLPAASSTNVGAIVGGVLGGLAGLLLITCLIRVNTGLLPSSSSGAPTSTPALSNIVAVHDGITKPPMIQTIIPTRTLTLSSVRSGGDTGQPTVSAPPPPSLELRNVYPIVPQQPLP